MQHVCTAMMVDVLLVATWCNSTQRMFTAQSAHVHHKILQIQHLALCRG